MSKVKKIIPSFFLMTALCGCTTQSIEDAKNIVETKTYAYRYEYETEQNGEAITQYHEEKPTNTDYVEDTEENILYLQSKASMLKFMKMNETFTNGDCEYKVTDVIATTYRDYAYELVNDEYTEGMMDYLKKIRNVDDNGYLTDKEYRFIWVKLNIKYNGRSSTKLNMSTSLYVKKNDKLVSYGSYLIESKELWLLPDSEEKVAGRVAVNPGEEMDMWICFKTKYNSGYTYYMTGSFGYNDDPRLYTGNLIELNIEDKE